MALLIPIQNFHFCTQCSVKCGQGVQHRNVICRDSRGVPSGACSAAWKPVSQQPCTGPKKNCKNTSKGTNKDGKPSLESGQTEKDGETKEMRAAGTFVAYIGEYFSS